MLIFSVIFKLNPRYNFLSSEKRNDEKWNDFISEIKECSTIEVENVLLSIHFEDILLTKKTEGTKNLNLNLNVPKINFLLYEEVNISWSSGIERTKKLYRWPYTREKKKQRVKLDWTKFVLILC